MLTHDEVLTLLKEDDKYVKIASMLKLLSNSNRLMILTILSECPRSVNEIHELLSSVSTISQSSLSQHLALLRAHKIVNYKKNGQMSTYYITDERFIQLLAALKDIDLVD